VDEPVEDQWPYHAVAGALRAHSLLAAHPSVDASKIGLTGISWGGYLTCVVRHATAHPARTRVHCQLVRAQVSGVDERYRFAAPVYGCGFLHENSVWSNPGPGQGNRPGQIALPRAGRW
jgi:hypothetical protein